MSNEPAQSSLGPRVTTSIDPADLAAHVAKVKAAWRGHERVMTWEQKIAVIEPKRRRSAQLDRARKVPSGRLAQTQLPGPLFKQRRYITAGLDQLGAPDALAAT